MVAPNINSYSRLTPGYWAPTAATWGIDNRTVGIRVIPGSPKSQRLEYRVPGSDVNPYLSMAAAIGSGLLGIERGIDPGARSVGNAYAQDIPESRRLPGNLEPNAHSGIVMNGANAFFKVPANNPFIGATNFNGPGSSTSLPVPADYDGDGKADPTTYTLTVTNNGNIGATGVTNPSGATNTAGTTYANSFCGGSAYR